MDESYDPPDESVGGSQEYHGVHESQNPGDSGDFHDECACLGALEDLIVDWTDRLVPDHHIMSLPLRLHGSCRGLIWGYTIFVEWLTADLYAIQDAVLHDRMADEQALTDARVKVYAAVLKLRNAKRLTLRFDSPVSPPELAQIGHYCATAAGMYQEMLELGEECGISMRTTAAPLVVNLEQE